MGKFLPSFYRYWLSINQFDVKKIRNEWNKKIEIPILSRQWKSVLNSIAIVSMDLKLQLI